MILPCRYSTSFECDETCSNSCRIYDAVKPSVTWDLADPAKRDFSQVFSQEYLCQPSSDADPFLSDLAKQYHETCESYDRTVCRGPIKDGQVMPSNGSELSLISRHAESLREQQLKQILPLGYTRRDWLRAIQKADRPFPLNVQAMASADTQTPKENGQS
jgi:hypothetical protein